MTYTQGYWKTHGYSPAGNNSNMWPVNGLTLGAVGYSDIELLLILNEQAGDPRSDGSDLSLLSLHRS
jgi:hypothetical protein